MKALAWSAALCALGCTPTPPAKDPTTALIEKCTAEARAEHYVGGKSVDEAMRAYDACIARGGLNVPR